VLRSPDGLGTARLLRSSPQATIARFGAAAHGSIAVKQGQRQSEALQGSHDRLHSLTHRRAHAQGEAQACLTLLLLGELGRVADLSAFPAAEAAITAAVASGADEAKATAALALGGIAVGNPKQYLPLLLERVRRVRDAAGSSASQLYLLLKAVNELARSLNAAKMPLGASVPLKMLRQLLRAAIPCSAAFAAPKKWPASCSMVLFHGASCCVRNLPT
jgi:hypothetical protein